jgi:DNA integrity scanning protein DisA with diadenylate cyclase activity
VCTIDLFMWGYQVHFRISAQVAAKGIFKRLDENLKPSVFLVGILFEELENRHPICVEPQDCGYDPEWFLEVKEQAKHLEALDEERLLFHSHPIAQENHDHRIKLRSLKNAIQVVLNRIDRFQGLISFCSWPVLVEGYMVCVVLQFERRVFDSHYSLTKNRVDNRYTVPTSLLDAAITEYLNGCSSALTKPDPGSGLAVLGRDYDEIIRSAGEHLMVTPAWAGGAKLGLHGLFHACNTISSLRYEGAEGVGRMLIVRHEHPNVEMTIAFSSPIPIRDYRAVRKLLEISSQENCLLSDSACIYGLGQTFGLYNYRREDLFEIDFTRHYTWDLKHAGHVLMQVSYRQPQLPRMRIDERKFKSDVQRIFGDVGSKATDKLWELTLEATEQKHGTMVVVSGEAEIEAARLETQSIRIEPLELEPEIMRMVTAIDGAVLIDPHATCYAIGVILDGLASKKGNPARGARYNSAIRYVEGKEECLAIVVSEDGSIDLIPDLMPQIPRSAVTEAVAKLRSLRGASTVNVGEFNKAMKWLSEHRFYLLPEVCEEVNSLRREIEGRFEKDTTVRVVYDGFVPNEEMNESYFLDESVLDSGHSVG